MPLIPSQEELSAILADDDGFRSLLQSLPESDQQRIAQILADPSLFSQFLGYLPASERQQIEQTLTAGMDEAQAALNMFEQCRFFEARELLHKTLNNYTMPDGLPADDGLIKAASFVVIRVQALCLDLLGSIEHTLGNAHLAREYHLQALALAQECGDLDTSAKAHHGLGVYYYEIGDYEQAMEHSRRALELLENGADRWTTRGKALNTLSLIHAELARWDDALRYGEQALAEIEERQDMKFYPVALSNRAVHLAEMKEFDKIWPLLERALRFAEDRGAWQQVALVRHNMGMHYLNIATDIHDVEQGLNQFKEAKAISRRVNDVGLEAMACNGTAQALIMLHDNDGAEREFRQAVELYRSIGATADCADSLVELGNTLRFCHNNLSSALECYREAIDLTEQVRARLKRESHRIGLAEARTEPYQQIITTLLEMGKVDEAFQYLERARSKALLELLAGQFMADSGDGLFGKTVELATRIAELRRALEEIRKAEETGTHVGSEEKHRSSSMRSAVLQGLEEEERQFKRNCEELQSVSPEQYGLVAVQASDSAAVQTMLPVDTALVELYQTANQLLLFIIRPDHSTKVVTVELAADDAAAAVFPFIAALRAPASFDTRSHDYLRTVRRPASQLYEMVIGPIEELLDGVKRLVVVPHLFWHYLPFHVLFDGINKQYLLDRFEISYSPSATVLKICRDKKRLNRNSALILCRDDGDLPHVETEGAAINKLFEISRQFCKSDATFGKLTSLPDPDVIHCACHGYFDPEQPFLSGIAIPPDQSKERSTMLMDILRMKLGSSLVTLSACDTGLNTISNADELVGLSRGFFGAGVAALLLSLWKVSDSSTAYLMENFYWHYVVNRQTKGRALQLAMQAVRAQPEYTHPYYWAPFVVMGEWG